MFSPELKKGSPEMLILSLVESVRGTATRSAS